MIVTSSRVVFVGALMRHVGALRKSYMRYTIRVIDERIQDLAMQPYSAKVEMDTAILLDQRAEAEEFLKIWTNVAMRSIGNQIADTLISAGYRLASVIDANSRHMQVQVYRRRKSGIAQVSVFSDVSFVELAEDSEMLRQHKYIGVFQFKKGRVKALKAMPKMA